MANYNTSPYYDDFDENKNFHRVLFKPGVAVQARELTQLQTILQDQITKFGKHVFQDGSLVLGGEIFIDKNAQSVRLKPTYNGSAVDVTAMSNLFAKGSVTGLIGQVKHVYAADVPTTGDPATIVIKPRNSVNSYRFDSEEDIYFYPTQQDAITDSNVITLGATTVADVSISKTGTCSVNSTTLTVSSTSGVNVGDLVTASGLIKTLYVATVDSSTDITLSDTAGVVLSNVSFTFTQKNTQPTLEVSFNEGVYFKKGYFVKSLPQSVIPKKYTAYPSASIGLTVSESITTSDDDATLLDPAIESYNYFAPGADRISLSLDIKSLDVTDGTVDQNNDPDFIEIVRVIKGVINKEVSKTQYSVIDEALAQRSYDESGNYTVKPFILNVTETSDADTALNVDVLPGSAYVGGYKLETISPTRINIDKARDTENVAGFQISPYYGNFILANVVGGSLLTPGSNVELHRGNTTHTAATKIGTALLKQIDYDSGSTTGTVYKIFLNDINLSSNTFSNVRHIVKVNSNTYDSSNVTFLANVDATGLVANVTQLYDSGIDTLLFKMPQGSIKTVSTTDYVFRKVYTDASFTSGITTISTAAANEDFVGGTGTLSSTIAKQYYYVVSKSNSGTFTKGQIVPMDGSGRTVNIAVVPAGSPGSAQININDASFNGLCDIYATIQVTADTRKVKTLVSNAILTANISTAGVANTLSVSDVYSVTGVFPIGSNTYGGAWSSLTTYVSGNVVVYNGLAYTSNATSTNTIPVDNTAYWTSITPVTSSEIVLDNGQRDNYYDFGTVSYQGATPPGNVVITYNYFTHSGGLGYFNVDSYPIGRSKIPSYSSLKTGVLYRLADCYDFRPRRTDGSSSLTFDSYRIPTPYSFIDTDYSYYLPRIDKVAIDKSGIFKVLKGTSSFVSPGVPLDDPDAMTFATVNVPAYTAYSDNVMVEYTNRRRYTMKDIGDIDERLRSVEYYTALSLLEKEVLAASIVDANNSALFKNGYLVDSFSGFSVVDIQSPEYGFGSSIKLSIDPDKKLARPSFDSTAYAYTFDEVANPDVQKSESLLTFPYTEKLFIKQDVASKIINVNPFNIVSFLGVLKITPNSDFWYDSVSKPIINIVNNDDTAFAAANAQAGTQWGDWQRSWTGTKVTNTFYKAVRQDDPTGEGNTTWTKGAKVTALAGHSVYVYDQTRDYGEVRSGVQTSVSSKLVVNTDTTQTVAQDAIAIARQTTLSFKIYGMPPLTELSCYINTSTKISQYITPDGKALGDKLYTDNSGSCKGTLILPNTDTIKIPTGKIRISFADSDVSFTDALSRAEAIFTSSGILNTLQRTIVSTREPVLVRTNVTDSRTQTEVVKANKIYVTQDPLAQSFYVDPQVYPDGIFLSSAELYFATKDDTIPVKMHLRPIENGYPSSVNIVPFSETHVDAANVIAPADVTTIYDSIGEPTKFTFDAPVYLSPTGYSLVVSSASDNYNVYAAETGQYILGTTKRITGQPYTGVLFKSQNADTWNAYQTEDLCFKLNQAVFETGTVSCVLDIAAPVAEYDFDVANPSTQSVNFNSSSITYELSTKTKSANVMSDFSLVSPGTNYEMSERMNVSAAGDVSTRITLTNTDPNISPVVDMDRLNTIFVKNKIDAYSDTINNSELTPYSGTAQAKYITRRVTLAEGLDATGLNVIFDLCKRPGTTTKVFYKILNKYDSTDFDERPWVAMTASTNNGNVDMYTNPDEFIETTYQALDLTYTTGSATYTDFKVFAVKVVFYTDNPAIVPQIRSMRVTAVT